MAASHPQTGCNQCFKDDAPSHKMCIKVTWNPWSSNKQHSDSSNFFWRVSSPILCSRSFSIRRHDYWGSEDKQGECDFRDSIGCEVVQRLLYLYISIFIFNYFSWGTSAYNVLINTSATLHIFYKCSTCIYFNGFYASQSFLLLFIIICSHCNSVSFPAGNIYFI